MSFNQGNFAARFGAMGDEAEKQFEQWCEAQGWKYERFGWNRPSTGMGGMSRMLRNTPDFYADHALWEVMGMGRDGILKGLKTEKWEAMKDWNRVQRVGFFIWNSSTKRPIIVSWQRMVLIVARARRAGLRQFHDGPMYYAIELEWLE